MTPPPPPAQRPFAALRQLARPRAPVERCELCGLALPPEHPHLLDLTSRRLACSCGPCAVLFEGGPAGRFRRIPRDARALPDFRLTDAQWDGLRIPIGLAFFYADSAAGKVAALYPGPAGATESLLPLETWQELVAANPVLAELAPDVEALLVNRLRGARGHYRVPIDKCYALVGLIRAKWRGLAGGAEVWEAVGRFFADLEGAGCRT